LWCGIPKWMFATLSRSTIVDGSPNSVEVVL